MQLSIVIPVYNEQATIIELLDRVAAVNIEKEVIVVDDFSTDGTRALLENYRNEAFTLLLHDRNQGKAQLCEPGFSMLPVIS